MLVPRGVRVGVVGGVGVGGVDASCPSASPPTTSPDRGRFEEIVVMLLLLLLKVVVDGCRRCCRLEQVVGLVMVVMMMVVMLRRRRRRGSSSVVGGHGLEEIVLVVVVVGVVGAQLAQMSGGPRAAHAAPAGLEVEIVLGGHAHALHEVGLQEGAVRVREGHAEERFRVADELVDVAFAGHFLHDALLVVVTQRAAQLVIVHGRPVLLQPPAPGHLQAHGTPSRNSSIVYNTTCTPTHSTPSLTSSIVYNTTCTPTHSTPSHLFYSHTCTLTQHTVTHLFYSL